MTAAAVLPATAAGTQWSAGSERELDAPVGATRVGLLQAVRGLGFTTTSEQYTYVEAERGSKLGTLSLTRTRMPVRLRIDLQAIGEGGNGTCVTARMEDRLGSVHRSSALAAVYGHVFTEVLTKIDDALKRIDPQAASGFAQWWRLLPEADVAAGESQASAAGRLEAAISRRASRLLEGRSNRPATVAVQAGVGTVAFTSPDSVAQVSVDVIDGMLTAGRLIASKPGAMPRPLVEQVQAMVVLLETRLAEAARAGAPASLPIEVAKADEPVVSFLLQQAALRDRLPVRLLMTCTTCRLEKVTNPDFVKLRERNRRIRVLTSSAGVAFGSHQISPFILLGRLSQLHNSDPDFVCQRCQGTDADEQPITFCPRCGDRRDESVLRSCARCSLDLRTLLPASSPWQAIDAPSEAPSAPAMQSAGWYADPVQHYEFRYWDGKTWTEHVANGQTTTVDR